jgi:hypothetical protein
MIMKVPPRPLQDRPVFALLLVTCHNQGGGVVGLAGSVGSPRTGGSTRGPAVASDTFGPPDGVSGPGALHQRELRHVGYRRGAELLQIPQGQPLQ